MDTVIQLCLGNKPLMIGFRTQAFGCGALCAFREKQTGFVVFGIFHMTVPQVDVLSPPACRGLIAEERGACGG